MLLLLVVVIIKLNHCPFYFFVDVLGTIDFVDKGDGNIVFRTCDREKDRVVVQLGTCNAERALKIAKLMYVQ